MPSWTFALQVKPQRWTYWISFVVCWTRGSHTVKEELGHGKNKNILTLFSINTVDNIKKLSKVDAVVKIQNDTQKDMNELTAVSHPLSPPFDVWLMMMVTYFVCKCYSTRGSASTVYNRHTHMCWCAAWMRMMTHRKRTTTGVNRQTSQKRNKRSDNNDMII